MEKIDRLGWAAGFSFSSYGLKIGVRATRGDVLGALKERLPPGWKSIASSRVERLFSLVVGGEGPRPGVRRFHVLYEGALRLIRTLDLEELLEIFESRVRLAVAEEARSRLFVHAGVVGWKGKAILLPGRSFSGKTSLVAALVREGAVYYSDEYAVLDSQGRVHPFPKPLSIREGSSVRQKNYPVEALGGRAGKKALPVGLVVVSRYRQGARFRPKTLSAGRGVLALLSHTVAARQKPEEALTILRRVATRAPVWEGARGEASAIAPLLLQRLETQDILE